MEYIYLYIYVWVHTPIYIYIYENEFLVGQLTQTVPYYLRTVMERGQMKEQASLSYVIISLSLFLPFECRSLLAYWN